MDFYGMKRKDLQALCKKHDIPANLTNLEMANKLASLLKVVEKPLTEGGSCLKRKDEKIRVNDSDVENRQIKKARLSLENEAVGLVNLGGSISKTLSRVRSVGKKGDQAVENVDTSESCRRIVEKPVRVQRSRVPKSVEGDLVMDSNPPIEKERGKRAVKDVDTTTDEPPLLPLPLPMPTNVEFSDNTSIEKPKLPKRRSMKRSPNLCVEKKRERRAAKDMNPSDKPPLPPAKPLLPPPVAAEISDDAANEEPGLPKRRLVKKKREGNVAKDVNNKCDKSPLEPPILPPPPPTATELSDNEDEEPGVPKRRSFRKRGVVESGEVQILERKRERKVAKDVTTSDKPPLPPPMPPLTVAALADNAANEEPRLQKRTSMKNKRGIEGDKPPLPPPMSPPTAPPTVVELADNAATIEEPRLQKRRSVKTKGVIEDVPFPKPSFEKKREQMAAKDSNTSDGAAANKRLLRSRDVANSENTRDLIPSNSVSKVRKPLQPLPTNGFGTPNLIGIEETKKKPTRRSLRNKENVVDFVVLPKNAEDSNRVPKKETVAATAEIIKDSKQKEAKAEVEIYTLKQESGNNEKVKRQRVTRASQLTKASTVDCEIRSKEVLQLEESVQHRHRNHNKRKCDENGEEPLKGYIRNRRENEWALHFTNRAGDIGSSNLIDSASQVGQARGGVVFWCNGSGCFALPKW